jgi:hypothetical protein
VYVAEFYVFEVFHGCPVCFEGLLGQCYREVLHHEVGVEDQEAVGYCFVEGCYEAGYFPDLFGVDVSGYEECCGCEDWKPPPPPS